MSRLFAGFLALAMLAALPGPAEAARIQYTVSEHMDLVAETQIRLTPGGKEMALCHYYSSTTVFGIGFWLSSNGYVLSDSNCQGTAYYDEPELIAAAFEDGQIAADVPRSAGFSLQERAQGHLLALILAALVLLSGLKKLLGQRKTKAQQRMDVLGLDDGPLFRFIDVMLHAAKADGKTQDEEVEYIRRKATELAQLDYTRDHIAWAIDRTERLSSPRDFRRFGHGLKPDQARVVLRAALAVVAADGTMTRAERRFISQLATGLSLDASEIEEIMEPPQGAQPA